MTADEPECGPPARPRISVIVVSDYETGEKSWADERRILHALAAQDIAEPFEILLAEHDANRNRLPADLLGIAPRTRIEFFPLKHSSTLKDAAVPCTQGSLVAVFEADSRPLPPWLRIAARAIDTRPGFAVVSGRTTYGGGGMLMRSLSLLDRGFLEVRGVGSTHNISNNAALYRREVLEAFPYPADDSPFLNASLRTEKIMQAGHRLLFHPEAVSIHEFGGLHFVLDVRRNLGFMEGRADFLRAPQTTFAGRLRRRLALSWKRLRQDSVNARRAWRGHMRWYDWPLTALLLLAFRFVEWPAMGRGLAGQPMLSDTNYR